MRIRFLTNGSKWKIQYKGWFCWKDIECFWSVIVNLDGYETCGHSIKTFNSKKEAYDWVINRYGNRIIVDNPWIVDVSPVKKDEDPKLDVQMWKDNKNAD